MLLIVGGALLSASMVCLAFCLDKEMPAYSLGYDPAIDRERSRSRSRNQF